MTFQKDCPHCDPNSFALKYPLLVTDNFYVVCDVHPLVEGHLLIIPKDHISCAGALSPDLFAEFSKLYGRFYSFVKAMYGKVASFEHGVTGQTVFHAHIHILPFEGKPIRIVPEGSGHIHAIQNIEKVREVYQRDRKYLFYSIGKNMWNADISIGAPRFFRDRFARALGAPERGNWRMMERNTELMKKVQEEIVSLKNKWHVQLT